MEMVRTVLSLEELSVTASRTCWDLSELEQIDQYSLCSEMGDTDFIVEGSEYDATTNLFNVKAIRD
jgi:hypothetical protein